MAQYRLSVGTASRASGRSGLAMAAYRAAAILHDPKTGETIDYTRKQGVLFAQVIAPTDAPEWASNRQELWSRSESAHRRRDAVVAREIQLSLPCELTPLQREELAVGFARFFADKYNVAVDTAIHAPNREGDERNFHAHLLFCTRSFDATKPGGLGNNVREFDAISHQRAQTENHVEQWRDTWARHLNDALERADVRDGAGVSVAVDHRSYERQGRDQEPTIKEGVAATAMKRRGESTERTTENADIRQRNAERDALADEIAGDVQELQRLRRRQAELLSAHELREAILPTPPRTETIFPRSARDLSAPALQKEFSTSDPPPAPDTKPPRMPWEGDVPTRSEGEEHPPQRRIHRGPRR